MSKRKKRRQYSSDMNGTFPSPLFGSYKEMRAVLQGRLAPSPKPKEITHVVLDADDTIWQLEPWSIASLAAPIGNTLSDDVLVTVIDPLDIDLIPEFWSQAMPTGFIKLDSTLRETLDKLNSRGISVSIASSNTKESIMAFLDAFGLTDKFLDVQANMHQSKGEMVREIAKRNGLDTKKMLFVNDSYSNILDVATNTEAIALVKGYNVASIADIMEYIE